MRPASPPTREDRYRGALLGLAVGDAIGTTVEFSPRGTFAPVTDMTGGGPFGLPVGAWTDDTSMALCLADSLLDRRDHDPADVLRRYVRWYRHGERSSTGTCFDIGNATRQALERFEQTGDAQAGTAFPNAGGNGVLMRLAPLAMACGYARGAAITATIAESNTTHGHPAARDAAKVLAALLVDALQGGDRLSVLGPDAPFVSAAHLDGLVSTVTSGSFRVDAPDVPAPPSAHVPPGIVGSGFAPKALEAALWTVWSTTTFADAVLAAVNLGDDADTTAAITGQLAGALYGAKAIPYRRRERVHLGDEFVELADALRELADERAIEHARLPRYPGAPERDPQLPNDAFWFREHELLAGPYPGAKVKDEAAAKLDALLDLGVRWFVDLTEDADGLRPYERLLHARAKARGIPDVWHVRLPIRDVDVPSPTAMRVILDVLARARTAGRIVYVHCWGGVGRTVTVLGCEAMEHGATVEEALAQLADARRFTARARAGRVAPETAAQRAFVAAWRPPYVAAKGEDELLDGGGELSEAAQIRIIAYLGAMLGAAGAATLVTQTSKVAGQNLGKKVATQALTKTAWYPLVKKVGAILGQKITKKTIEKTITKAVPIVGGVVSGGLTYVAFRPMGGRLADTLAASLDGEFEDELELRPEFAALVVPDGTVDATAGAVIGAGGDEPDAG
ncbi:MAG: ADP-ribosylglycohydrolase family protein [Solirubrobacteraceae bacterium]|nr:ADP-ribosylglycohydrolase family protein [Solirubrobacteraceae bacterium]